MTQTNQTLISHVHIALPCENVTLIMELVKKLGGEIITQEQEYIVPAIPENERVGRMLRGLRLRAGLTQKQLAGTIGVPQSHISQYENNTRAIPKDKVEALANILNTVKSHFISM